MDDEGKERVRKEKKRKRKGSETRIAVHKMWSLKFISHKERPHPHVYKKSESHDPR